MPSIINAPKIRLPAIAANNAQAIADGTPGFWRRAGGYRLDRLIRDEHDLAKFVVGSEGWGSICSGGRYDGLITQLGGEPTPGVGFAMGVERAVALLEQAQQVPAPAAADVYVVVNGAKATAAAPALLERLRDELPRLRFELNLGGGNFKKQFSRADRSGAAVALILGDDELARGVAGVKPLLRDAGQTECPIASLATGVADALGKARA